jgi:hypothetical protein
LEYFVCHCAQQLKLGYSTIKLYLCAVKHAYVMLGYGDIIKDKPRLNLTLRGIKKVHSHPQRPRLPITSDILFSLHRVLSQGVHGTYTDIMLWAVLCLVFSLPSGVGNLQSKQPLMQSLTCVGVTLFSAGIINSTAKYFFLPCGQASVIHFARGLPYQYLQQSN